MVKSFIVGATLGALIAAPLAYNYGRGVPLLSNPFEERNIGAIIVDRLEAIRHLTDDAKEGLKNLADTKPKSD